MTGTKLSPISNTDGAFVASPLPKFVLHLEDASQDMANLLIEMNINKVLRDAVLSTYKWLFTPQTAPTHVKSITVAVKTMQTPFVAGMENDDIYMYCSNQYIKTKKCNSSAQAIFKITSDIAHAVAYYLLCPRFKDESYPDQFPGGLADYVKIKEGFLPPHPNAKKLGCLWYSNTAMPYFLDWIDQKYGEGTVCRLNAAFGAPYDKSVFEKVTGVSINNLWKMYCVSIGNEDRENERFNEKNSALWLPPTLCISIMGEEGPDISIDRLKDLVCNAVLAFLNHFYTPRTNPRKLQEICLVLQPGMEGPFLPRYKASGIDCVASLERVKSGEVSEQDIMGFLVACIVAWHQGFAQLETFTVRDPSMLVGLTGKTFDELWCEYEATPAEVVAILSLKELATDTLKNQCKPSESEEVADIPQPRAWPQICIYRT